MANRNPNYILNLKKPWPKGVSGNLAGKPKGTRHLSTIIKDMLESEQIDFSTFPVKPTSAYMMDLKERYKNKSPWEAIVSVAVWQALEGDDKARTWLAKAGYGEKVQIEGQVNVIGMILHKHGLADKEGNPLYDVVFGPDQGNTPRLSEERA